MNFDKYPFFYYNTYGISSFIGIGICILEKTLLGTLICFFLFCGIWSLKSHKKKKMQRVTEKQHG
ncbi:DUF5325 family protein [Niallia sp. JL1B1071]|uniref:DUF5325 family protein n=1 Tax=Niallia tiangongensis TaxID=3237105 RepID=UPI0037DCF5D9